MSATHVVDAPAPRISDREFASIQRYVDAIIDAIAAMHLSVVIETDFMALYRFLRSQPGAFVYPTFNPFESDLSRDSFWLRVIDGEGTTVACHAQRVFVTEDFRDLIRTGRLWFGAGAPLDPARTSLIDPTALITGRVAHAGSLWIDPGQRKRGLSVWLPYLSRLACLRNFSPDFFSALVFERMAAAGVPAQAYGYTHVEPILTGHFAPTDRDETVYVCYMSWRDAVDKIRMLADHPKYPIDPDRERAP
ncbi:MAG: hypothetical protein JNL66_02445 [Alphaproteobacteria bacterium]|nr:hypothetical protein [Alphaproteobacteria bacterium]